MRKPDLRIDGATLGEILSFCVYAWRRGDRLLYVGVSGNGLARPFNHPIIGAKEEVRDSDTIDVWFFKTWAKASKFELTLIHGNNPTYNIVGNPTHIKNRKRAASYGIRMAAFREYNRDREEREIGWSERSGWTGEVPL